jgi:NAD-dependent DNA ligase
MFTFTASKANASIIFKIDRNMISIMDDVNKLTTQDPKSSMSSNPYSYINNANYKSIIELGSEALPILVDRIDQSKENGLKEYILAIATEKIAKVDLKKDGCKWGTAKEFTKVWKTYLKQIPTNVNNIVASNEANEKKVQELVLQGIPAIPFIMDKIEQGNTGLFPSLDQLLRGNPNFTMNQTTPDESGWVKNHKSQFNDLRDLVNKES